MPREALIGVGAGLASAAASLAFIAEIPFALVLVYFSPLPLIAVGLANGAWVTVVGSFVGLLATALGGGVSAMIVFSIIQGLPSILLVYLALLTRQTENRRTAENKVDWFPFGHIVAHLGLLGGTSLVIVAIFASNQGLSSLISEHLTQAMNVMAPHLPTETRLNFANMLTPLFPGAVATSWIIMIIVNGLLAQRLLIHLSRNLRPSEKYIAMALPHWLSWPLIGAATITLAASGEWEYVGRNAAMVFATPYFLLGLAVVHSLAHRVTYTFPLLIGLYLVIMLSLWAALVVAGVGIIEQWFGIRDRTQNLPTQSCGGNEQ